MYPHLSAALSIVNSGALRHAMPRALCNDGMNTVEEVRRLRLAQLLNEFRTYAELNSRLGNTSRDSTLSQIASESIGSKTGKPKAMGSPMARRLEKACDKPEGWMDRDPECDRVWPFAGRVDVERISKLPADLLSEAVGALNEVLRRAEASSGKDRGQAAA